jgi:hypothetical protein
MLLLASCGRPETPAYFKKVTRLPLCDEASVRNVNADAPDRSPGFDVIYIVDLKMTARCENQLLAAVAGQISATCNPLHMCSGNARNGDFYSVEPIKDGLRVTYAT